MKIVDHPVGVAISSGKIDEIIGGYPERIVAASAVDDVGAIAVERATRRNVSVSGVECEEIGSVEAEQEIVSLLADDLIVGIGAGQVVRIVSSLNEHGTISVFARS